MQENNSSRPKGLPGAQVAKIADLIAYQTEAVVSRELVKKPTGTITVFAFDEGQGLSEHMAPYDALVQILDGEAEVTISGEVHLVHGGEVILLPAQKPHSLNAVKPFKMMLTMIRS